MPGHWVHIDTVCVCVCVCVTVWRRRRQTQSRNGRHGYWPNYARTSPKTAARTLSTASHPGIGTRPASAATPIRRERCDALTVCARRTRSGGWTWWWWYCSVPFRWKALTESDWRRRPTACIRHCVWILIISTCLLENLISTWLTSSTATVYIPAHTHAHTWPIFLYYEQGIVSAKPL